MLLQLLHKTQLDLDMPTEVQLFQALQLQAAAVVEAAEAVAVVEAEAVEARQQHRDQLIQ